VARANRLCRALPFAGQTDVFDKQSLVRVHNLLVDSRFEEIDWRRPQTGIFTPQADGTFRLQKILPKPDDIPAMMLGWQKMTARLSEAGFVEPIIAAAVASLSLLLIHPFEDGNVRLQRVVGEAVLRRLAQNLPLPLALVLDRERAEIEAATGQFLRSIDGCINFTAESAGRLSVQNETGWLYRYPDLTGLVEAFCASVNRTIREESRPGLAFHAVQDSVLQAIRYVVDLPRARRRSGSLAAYPPLEHTGI
jgi:hypothetical protein